MKTRVPTLFGCVLTLAVAGCGGAASAQLTATGDGGRKESLPAEAYVEVVELPTEASGGVEQPKKPLDELVTEDQKGGGGGPGATEGAGPDDVVAAPPPIEPPRSAATTDAVSGRVDAAQIRAAVARNMPVFAACLEVDSVVEIDATISPQGEVSQAKATRSQPDNPKTRDCVGLAFSRIRLEPLSPPAPAHVRLALSLRKPSSY